MKAIKESILKSVGSGKVLANKILVKKLKDQSNRVKFTPTHGNSGYDCFGNEVVEGDIIVQQGSYATCIIKPLLVVGFDKKIDNFAKVYDPYSNEEIYIGLTSALKLYNPEKYLK